MWGGGGRGEEGGQSVEGGREREGGNLEGQDACGLARPPYRLAIGPVPTVGAERGLGEDWKGGGGAMTRRGPRAPHVGSGARSRPPPPRPRQPHPDSPARACASAVQSSAGVRALTVQLELGDRVRREGTLDKVERDSRITAVKARVERLAVGRVVGGRDHGHPANGRAEGTAARAARARVVGRASGRAAEPRARARGEAEPLPRLAAGECCPLPGGGGEQGARGRVGAAHVIESATLGVAPRALRARSALAPCHPTGATPAL